MPPPGLVVRAAKPADGPALGRLGAALLRQHHALDPQRFIAPGADPEGGYAWFLGTQMMRDDACVLVAEQDGEVVGYAYAAIEPHDWNELRDTCGFVHDLFIAPEARGHGTGTALFAATLDWLRDRGAPRVVLWTARGNPGAERLFARMGFRATMTEMTLEL